MSPEDGLTRWDALTLDKVTDMVARKTVAGAELVLNQAYFKKGALVPVHRHAAELMIYVLQGALRVHLDGKDVTVREGEVLIVPAGANHQAESLDDTFLLSVTRAPAAS